MFHNNLKALRLKSGLPQKQVADFLSVSPQSVSKWERGDALPSIEFLPQMAEYFNCDINAFFEQQEEAIVNFQLINAYFALESDVLNEVRKFEEISEFLIENPNVVKLGIALCEKLMEYKTLTIKNLRGILNCCESEAKLFIGYLERCEMVEKLDIADTYFVIKDAVEGLIPLLKIQKEVSDIVKKSDLAKTVC